MAATAAGMCSNSPSAGLTKSWSPGPKASANSGVTRTTLLPAKIMGVPATRRSTVSGNVFPGNVFPGNVISGAAVAGAGVAGSGV